jgi:hypothetical protein
VDVVGERWALLVVRELRRRPAGPVLCRLDLGGSVWTVRVVGGTVEVDSGEPATADVALRTDPKTLSGLLADPAALDAALADGSVALVGDLPALKRLLYGA